MHAGIKIKQHLATARSASADGMDAVNYGILRRR